MNNKNKKLLYLEGVRGVAACIVVLAHLKNVFYVDLKADTLNYFSALTHSNFAGTVLNSFVEILFDGKLAVEVFWFMSGYVISIRLFSKDGISYLKTAMIKRYFRLAIPILGSVLLAWGLLKMGWMYNQQLAALSTQKYGGLAAYYHFEPNFLNALRSGLWDALFNFKPWETYNGPLWSMEPELYGSFSCFILFAVFKTMPYRYLVYFALSILAVLLGYYWPVTFIMGLTLSDIDHTSNKIKPVFEWLTKNIFSKWYYTFSLLLLLVIINGFGQKYYSAYIKMFVSTVFIITVMNSELLRRFFSHKIPVWLGKISFSVYLVHHPIICSLACYLFLYLGYQHAYSAIVTSLISFGFILAMGYLFTKLIDGPAIRYSNAIAKKLLKLWYWDSPQRT